MSLDSLPNGLVSALEAERQRVAAAAALSRRRLRARLDVVERTVLDGPSPAASEPVTAEPEPLAVPSPPAAVAVTEPEPAAPEPPAPEAPLRVSHSPSYPGLAISRRLVLFGVVILLFVGYERWLSPWVAQNGQASLRSQGAPTLSIPKLGVDLAVGPGTSMAALRGGPGHDRASSPLGGRGNIVIAGHRTSYGKPFARLGRLKQGDTIRLTGKTVSTYTVQSVRDDVAPAARSARAQHGDDRLTLVTASSRGRLVVIAMAAAGGERTGHVPARSTGDGPLWPTHTTVTLVLMALWGGAAVLLPRGGREVKRRWGPGPGLLAVVPAGCLVAFGLAGAVERVLGVLY